METLWQVFKTSVREGFRGSLAPYRPSLWRAAGQAAIAPNSTWSAPFRAWLKEYERVVKGS